MTANAGQGPRPFDLLIRRATVVDGTGAAGYAADVGLRGDRIAAIGRVEGAAARVIEAEGLVASPGFIDVHAHDDAAVLATPMDFKLMQGVTTDIVGNCGAGVAPAEEPVRRSLEAGFEASVLGPVSDVTWRTFGEYMQAVDRAKPALNVGCLVPHGVVRAGAMMLERRAPERAELEAMRDAAAEGMAAGALGLSTGLIYPPGAFAETGEIISLAEVAAEYGGLYVSHIRNEAERLMDALAEAARVGREAGLPVQVSHHKAAGRANWGMTRESIRFLEEQRADGLDITFDAYPYTAGSTILAAAAQVEGDPDFSEVMVASVRGKPEYEGKRITELAGEFGVSQREAVNRVLAADPAAVAVFFSMDEADVRRVISHPLCMIGSDGIPSPTGKPHPRLYGTFPRVIARYVRQERLLSLEEAVRKMTALPARRFGLSQRGELREGWFADLALFDPARLADVATYQEPRQYPQGMEYVIVNGQVAAGRGGQTPARAGRVLRRGDSR